MANNERIADDHRAGDATRDDLHLQVSWFVTGGNVHWLGHQYLSRGAQQRATACFRAATFLDVVAAEDDLAALRADDKERAARCPDLVEDWRDPRDADSAHPLDRRPPDPRAPRPARRWPARVGLVTSGFAAGVALLFGFAHQQDRPGEVPTAMDGGGTSDTVTRTFVSRREALPANRPAAEKPSGKATAGDRRRPVEGRYVEVNHVVDGKREYNAVAVLGGRTWRELTLRAKTPRFTATLWSYGERPCSWRFTGKDWYGRTGPGARTEEMVVPAGRQRDVDLSMRDWPVLAVEVRDGSTPESCLLVDYRFVPQTTRTRGPEVTTASPGTEPALPRSTAPLASSSTDPPDAPDPPAPEDPADLAPTPTHEITDPPPLEVRRPKP
ncbi:MAG TPA: hypothetical protein VFT95_02785 [Micromonosporaceae bacterium]|nr:hypothetical protein [Micromonosporaceae bacterium]